MDAFKRLESGADEAFLRRTVEFSHLDFDGSRRIQLFSRHPESRYRFPNLCGIGQVVPHAERPFHQVEFKVLDAGHFGELAFDHRLLGRAAHLADMEGAERRA
jgi:hypothetical protein